MASRPRKPRRGAWRADAFRLSSLVWLQHDAFGVADTLTPGQARRLAKRLLAAARVADLQAEFTLTDRRPS